MKRLALCTDREVDDARRSPVRGRDGARLEVVPGCRAAERHIEMRVNVDAAGEHVLPLRVNDPIALICSEEPMAAILSPSTKTSPSYRSVAVMTIPLRMRRVAIGPTI
jgi:hypothetical protein